MATTFPAPILFNAKASEPAGVGATATMNFEVVLPAPKNFLTDLVSYDYRVLAGEGASSADFTAKTGTISFGLGETHKVIPVEILGDAVADPDEKITLQLSLSNGGAVVGSATGTIIDTPPGTTLPAPKTPVISVTDAREAAPSFGSVSFAITLSEVTTVPVVVHFDTAGITATPARQYNSAAIVRTELLADQTSRDFFRQSGDIVFQPGETTRKIDIASASSAMTDDPEETFSLTLSRPVNASLGKAQAIGTLLADKALTRGGPYVMAADATVTEPVLSTNPAKLSFNVALVGDPVDRPVTVHYEVGGDAALPDKSAGDITFAPGEKLKTVSVPIAGHGIVASETTQIHLSGATNATIGRGTAEGTILPNPDRVVAPPGALAEGTKPAPGQDIFHVDIQFAALKVGYDVVAADYSGPVTYLQKQYIGSDRGEVLFGTAKNDFINLLGGDDAADGGAGDDVLDGGLGSNFLTGGAGRDVFFLDGRGGQATWATITDWQAGEELSLWGWKPGVSKVSWEDSQGARGYEGVTMHADLNGDGKIDASVTWSHHARADLPKPTEHDGLLWFHP